MDSGQMLANKLQEANERLQEARTVTREQLLTTLGHYLQGHYTAEGVAEALNLTIKEE